MFSDLLVQFNDFLYIAELVIGRVKIQTQTGAQEHTFLNIKLYLESLDQIVFLAVNPMVTLLFIPINIGIILHLCEFEAINDECLH